jgi:5'-3' exonuclease
VKIHLIDGTYELFRAYFALPSLSAPDGREVAAVRGLIQTLLVLLRQDGVTHIACAFDHVIESFRNDLFAGYKSGAGVPEDLLSQFGLAEWAVSSLGIVVWPMVEFEADDAIATAAARWWDAAGVEQVIICSPDKDLAQLVRDDRVIALDRRRNLILNEAEVMEKFGVAPDSIPDYLALVGDSADGIPGIPRWGAKTTAAVLRRYGRIEQIPDDPSQWGVEVRGAKAIGASLTEHREEALLYKKLATLRLDAAISDTPDQLEWRGVYREEFYALCQELGFSRLMELPHRWADEGRKMEDE